MKICEIRNTYPAILILIFLKNIVDCVQQLFYSTGDVSVEISERSGKMNTFMKSEALTQHSGSGEWQDNRREDH